MIRAMKTTRKNNGMASKGHELCTKRKSRPLMHALP
jgi:hypothetical protein